MEEPTIRDILARLRQGDTRAWDDLVPHVYEELRRQAAILMQRERPSHTLQPTALVHEAYLRLVKCERLQWEDRVHFLRVAARTMRRILVDRARARTRKKREGGWIRPLSMTSPEPQLLHQMCSRWTTL